MIKRHLLVPACCLAALAQSPAPRPEFEVASIKPSSGGDRRFIGSKGPGSFDAENLPLVTYIAEAYGVRSFQVIGAPGWVNADAYNITAKVVGAKNEMSEAMMADMRLRLQSLLEDRCSLKVHRETKELPVYALTVAKGGLKLKPADCVVPTQDNAPIPGQPRPAYCGNLGVRRNGVNSTLTATGIAVKDLIRFLSTSTGRTVIDKTGYADKFNAILDWTPDPSARLPNPDEPIPTTDNTGPSLFTALQEQLGLKLESSKGPVEVLVIDRVEKPSAN